MIADAYLGLSIVINLRYCDIIYKKMEVSK